MTKPPHDRKDASMRRRLRVRGAVQGVGFRPFVWRLAQERGLSGFVLNDEGGVLIEIEGAAAEVGCFERALRQEAPPLSRIDAVEAEVAALSDPEEEGFSIRQTAKTGAARTMITPDSATCDACLEEVFDPADRRHLYPFTNCTHCGPRYSITRALPYDRAQTSMAPFAMCEECAAEYHDPADRRFHAQPNACPACGPQLSMEPGEIVRRLRSGEILAIKGLGGFHLACDARNEAAVAALRRRKGRDAKPFAVMVAGLASARRLAVLSEAEAALLAGPMRPVTVLRSKEGSGLAPSVSAGLPSIGLMLPYTPLHALFFHAAAGAPEGVGWMNEPQNLALVMTSANPGGEPLVTGNEEAERRLAAIAYHIVTHDRDIVVRCDDSVVRMIGGTPAVIRRARGMTPAPIALPRDMPPVLALGGHLKNAVCVIRGREAWLSQHIGDMDNVPTYDFFREVVDHLLQILEVTPEAVACDLHPDFLSTRYAEETGLPLVRVQHHHAHIAAVAAEHGMQGPLLGLALDGYGYGEEGDAWGGELLLTEAAGFQRLGGLRPLALPGGERAAREPWRMAAAALHALGREDLVARRFGQEEGAPLIAAMLARGVGAPLTSSAGRLFDAAAGLLGVCRVSRFEGDAAMALEGLADRTDILPGGWRIGEDGTLDLRPLLRALIEAGPREGAALFHGTLAEALADWSAGALSAQGLPPQVAAAGGCLQNKVLAEGLEEALARRGIALLRPNYAPAGDGGLALGQAFIAAHERGASSCA